VTDRLERQPRNYKRRKRRGRGRGEEEREGEGESECSFHPPPLLTESHYIERPA
jgi:hypothetical protein